MFKPVKRFLGLVKSIARLTAGEKRIVLSSLMMSTTLLAFSVSPVILDAIHVSTSYNVIGQLSPSSAGRGDSTVYKMVGQIKERSNGIITGANYSIRNGILVASASLPSCYINSISPSSVHNTGVINDFEITDPGVKEGMTVKLIKSGSKDIIGTAVTVSSATLIVCSFDLTGADAGDWFLMVTDPSAATSATSPTALRIETWAEAGVVINSPNPFNPEKGMTTLTYRLDRNTDTSLMIYNITAELVYKKDFVQGFDGAKLGDNATTWNGVSSFGEIAANGVYFVRIVDRQSGIILARGKIAVVK